MRPWIVAALPAVFWPVAVWSSSPALHLIPRPASLQMLHCSVSPRALLTVEPSFDAGARTELDERWRGLGIGMLRDAGRQTAAIAVSRDAALPSQAYRLTVFGGRARIESSDAAGAFYGAMTLAQLPIRDASSHWTIPCVRIEDSPALRWRILSDDVSRGPLPTMRYFKERIRTIAAFKYNGYSPYMESAFVSPTDPLPAPLDGITPAQLRELAVYAARFHVALVPEQQTFAHMHQTLALETYAAAAELPHGFLIAPTAEVGSAYLERLLRQELQAVPHPPFFHVGSDETATLGLGQTHDDVASHGRDAVFAGHIAAMNRLIAPSGARIMLWDDAIEKSPAIMAMLPRSAVVVNYHYGAAEPFDSYIAAVARGGFEQMVAPGARNWDEVFPDVETAIDNERAFIAAGKRAGVLGMFETVWHDDGETLYEATWYPVLYAAAAAWQRGDVEPRDFAADFPSAFFGSDDSGYAGDITKLSGILRTLETAPYDRTNALFWTDAFDAAAGARMANVDLRRVRLDAEAVESHLASSHPPLHNNAAFVIDVAARRYDALARKFQIAAEVRDMYAQARANISDSGGSTLRDLYWSRYWMWELRDAAQQLATLYAQAWRYESREGHLDSNLERYHLAAQRAIGYADAVYRATYDGFVRNRALPPLHDVLGLPPP